MTPFSGPDETHWEKEKNLLRGAQKLSNKSFSFEGFGTLPPSMLALFALPQTKVYTKGVVCSENQGRQQGKKGLWCIPIGLPSTLPWKLSW